MLRRRAAGGWGKQGSIAAAPGAAAGGQQCSRHTCLSVERCNRLSPVRGRPLAREGIPRPHRWRQRCTAAAGCSWGAGGGRCCHPWHCRRSRRQHFGMPLLRQPAAQCRLHPAARCGPVVSAGGRTQCCAVLVMPGGMHCIVALPATVHTQHAGAQVPELSFTSPAAPQLCNLDGGSRCLLPHLWPLRLPRSMCVRRRASRWQVQLRPTSEHAVRQGAGHALAWLDGDPTNALVRPATCLNA